MGWFEKTSNLLGAVTRTFSPPGGVTYEPKNGSPILNMPAAFRRAHETVDPDTGTLVQSEQPALLIRLSDLNGHAVTPGHDLVTVPEIPGVDCQRQYVVHEKIADGEGGYTLLLHERPRR